MLTSLETSYPDLSGPRSNKLYFFEYFFLILSLRLNPAWSDAIYIFFKLVKLII